MISDWRLEIKEQMHFLPRGTELFNLKSTFLNLKSRGPSPYSFANTKRYRSKITPMLMAESATLKAGQW